MEEAKIANVESPRITSVEKVKDPKRVEAGKRLAAMSKQAKDKKAVERLSQRMSIDEFQIPTVDPLAVVGLVGVVGVVVYYKYFSGDKSETKSETKSKDKSKDKSEDKSETTPKVDPPKRRELDTLD